MLQLNNVKIQHLKDLKIIISELDFVVNKGEKVAIIGEEGTGKSTLLEWIYQPNQELAYVDISGKIINNFVHTEYIPQFIAECNLKKSVNEFIFTDKYSENIDYNSFYKLAASLDLDTELIHSQQILNTLSGGERLKVQLLKSLSLNPELLLLDEPSNDLDIQTIEWLEKFIKQTDFAILLVSHDELFLSRTVNKIIHLELQKHHTVPKNSVKSQSYQAYIEQRLNEINKTRQIALNQRAEDKKRTTQLNEVKSKVHNALGNASSPAEGRLLKKKMKTIKSTEKRFEREAANFEEIPFRDEVINIQFDDVQGLKGNRDVLLLNDKKIDLYNGKTLNHLNFRVQSFDKVGIVGNNGVGKSTFLKEIYRILSKDNSVSVGYMPQNYSEKLPPDRSPIEYLKVSGSKDEQTEIMTALGNLNFTVEEMDRPIQSLSGGQNLNFCY